MMRRTFAFVLLLLGVWMIGRRPIPAQEAIAQSTSPGSAIIADGRPAVDAAIDGPTGVAVDRSGNLYLTSSNESRVYKIGADGILRRIAGTGIPGFSGDGGPATEARLEAPFGVAVDAKGNVYVA